eukprot:7642016-Pyramimonas_sp.AAC.1
MHQAVSARGTARRLLTENAADVLTARRPGFSSNSLFFLQMDVECCQAGTVVGSLQLGLLLKLLVAQRLPSSYQRQIRHPPLP